ncbi:uncharacterized protein V1516DRAFT_664486 [Lipomyces oligophaga]|uniref:uncharacterized protein n=1 Tax=Lipomyces oligophaga TaxID=45792 RepID=UPI0034CF894E
MTFDADNACDQLPLWKQSPVFTGTTKFDKLEGTCNILVTGGAGFIASWLVRHLVLQYPEYNVVCLDNLDYCATLNNLKCLQGTTFQFVKGDITVPRDVSSTLEKFAIDTVFHLAALSHVDRSFGGDSFEFTAVNAYGTHVLLECCKSYGKVKKFIHVSTDEVYGEINANDDDLLESAILAPTNPYAASKAAADMLANSYYKSFKMPIVIVRCNNVYGPHQFPEKIIPKFVCLLESGRKCLIHGDGSNTRRYLYAGDAIDALDTILHKGTIGQIYNIGTADEISNLDLCKQLLDCFGYSATQHEAFIQHTQDRPFNDCRYAIDATRLKKLGWAQKTPFDQGIQITVDWYRTFGLTWWGDISDILTAFPVGPLANIRTM